ncbi:MAG: 4'-phosphopantetheinyl transferase superfamily protein [Paludibacteraceae bacterium]|nr:4'-phosphopantetheinyl transferase superfamily protein [Paludibacteraceae bacterium]
MIYRIFDDMTQCSEQEIARLLPLVSSQRREQALRYQHIFGQFCCLKSYIMLCDLLAEWGRVHQLPINEQPTFLYNNYGAPYIEGGPYFSISHCKTGIAVAVSEQPIGVDIEVIRPFRDELMRKTMNPIEQQTILNSNQADWAFIRLWTQKEALLKLQGTGIITDLHHTLDNTEHIKWLQTTHLQPDYICTIAMQ